MKNKLLIIGASGHGKVVADIAIKMNKWQSIAFLDDDKSIKSFMNIEVIGTSEEVFAHLDDYEITVGIGNNVTRQKIHEMLETLGASIPVLIHPNAVIGSQVDIGIGTVVMAGAIINCSAKVGKGCIINTGATVDHDSELEDFVHISPGVNVAGSVRIGRASWLGIGSVVSNNINIKEKSIIGAGSVVFKSLPESGIYVGIPARRVNKNEDSNSSK